jgi:predicted nuclease of restriction endonuclease-like (RecB) superfamily
MKQRDDGTKLAASQNEYARLLEEVKQRIRTAQVKAAFAANREMLALYWDIGRLIDVRQKDEGWGASVIPRLARDIRNELPEVKGFSERNIGRMIAFYREYPGLATILPTALAKLSPTAPVSGILPTALARTPASSGTSESGQRLVAQLPWAHNVLLMQKVKDLPTRCWYMLATLQEGWSHDVLNLMIDSRAHERQGKAVTNFADRLPPAQSALAQQALKDPYIFDFLTLEEPFHERELETTLVRHLEEFLVELGQGFAFVGRQVHMDVGEEDFYIDLLVTTQVVRSQDPESRMNAQQSVREDYGGPSSKRRVCRLFPSES